MRVLRRLAVGAVLAVTLLVAGFIVYTWIPGIGTPSAESLAFSIAATTGGNTGGLIGDDCQQRRDFWICRIPDRSSSGSAMYRVTTTGGLCWRAVKTSPDSHEEPPALPRRPSGCIKLHHQARLLHRAMY